MSAVSRNLNSNTTIDGLRGQATELWGKVRASQITPSLEMIALHLSILANDPPSQEDEPAFFL